MVLEEKRGLSRSRTRSTVKGGDKVGTDVCETMTGV